MPGIFDGILLCSDFDGTLYVKKEISKENADAIRYFQENGGIFTIASGRYPDFLAKYRDVVEANTYIVGMNGALVSNYERSDVVCCGLMPEGAKELVWRLLTEIDGLLYMSVFTEDVPATDRLEELRRPEKQGFYEYDISWNDRAVFDALMDCNVYKVMFRLEPEKADAAAEKMPALVGDAYAVSRSWKTGLELQSSEYTKGISTRRLAKHLGAHTLVCVGDYENDLSMILEADIGYAVGDAVLKLREAADRILPPAQEHAIAALIADLEKTVCK